LWLFATAVRRAGRTIRVSAQIDLNAEFIPVSGMSGDNPAKPSDNMKWFKGKTLLER
jgi:translation elongation factor EF-1alpha